MGNSNETTSTVGESNWDNWDNLKFPATEFRKMCYASWWAFKQLQTEGIPTDIGTTIVKLLPHLRNQDVIDDAIAHGWKIQPKGIQVKVYQCNPPIQFECRNWGGFYTEVTYRGQQVSLSNYIYDEEVRHTGVRKTPTLVVLGRSSWF